MVRVPDAKLNNEHAGCCQPCEVTDLLNEIGTVGVLMSSLTANSLGGKSWVNYSNFVCSKPIHES